MSVPHHEHGTASKFSANNSRSATTSSPFHTSSMGMTRSPYMMMDSHMPAGSSGRMNTSQLFNPSSSSPSFSANTSRNFDFSGPRYASTAEEFDFRRATASDFNNPLGSTASNFDFRYRPTPATTASDFDFRYRPTTAGDFNARKPTTASDFDFRRPTTASDFDFRRPTTASDFDFRRPTTSRNFNPHGIDMEATGAAFPKPVYGQTASAFGKYWE